jgi:hypothetical protein
MYVLAQRCMLRRKKDLAAIHGEPSILPREEPPERCDIGNATR